MCLSCAGLTYLSVLLQGILKLEIILQMLAVSCSESAIEFASFWGIH